MKDEQRVAGVLLAQVRVWLWQIRAGEGNHSVKPMTREAVADDLKAASRLLPPGSPRLRVIDALLQAESWSISELAGLVAAIVTELADAHDINPRDLFGRGDDL